MAAPHPSPLQWRYAPLPASGSTPPDRLDAYALWDALRGNARHRTRDPASDHVPVLLELAQGRGADGEPRPFLPRQPRLRAALRHSLDRLRRLPAAEPAGVDGARLVAALAASLQREPDSPFHTAILPQQGLLPLLIAASATGWLRRWQLGAGCRAPRPLAAGPLGEPQRLDGPVHTLGVIDDGFAIAHPDLRDGQQRSRLLYLWDQDPDAGLHLPWQRFAAAPADATAVARQPLVEHGAELSRRELSQLLHGLPSGEAAERGIYQALGRGDWGRPDRCHGARVMHLLAGPLDGDTGPPRPGADRVTELPLIAVQLPLAVLDDTSGDSLAMQVLDGVRYIVARTRAATAPGQRWRSTIVVSLGGVAGPHDGSSLVECALDWLIDHHNHGHPERVRIVVAAGNAAGQCLHVRQELLATAARRPLIVAAAAGHTRDSFVEFWIPGPALDALRVQVQPPLGPALPEPLRIGQVAWLGRGPVADDARLGAQAALIAVPRSAQGLNGTLLLLALAPTAAPPGAVPAPRADAGQWRLDFRLQGPLSAALQQARPLHVRGWVERDDDVTDLRRPQHTRFVDAYPPGHAQAQVSDEDTLSTLAHAARVVVAGGHQLMSQRRTRRSSLAPADRAGRMPSAPVDRSPSLPGVPVAGFHGGQRRTLGGTSAAAPQIARLLVQGSDLSARRLQVDPPWAGRWRRRR
ncbi:MAG: hypothetical protein KBC73_21930 [Burkholderiaceae bacterium]|nr:hypothetical protein [Burkholderiaceae bacterium]